ncbi:hypothetical protein TNCV_1359061 [Trichonephila clavipes]|nr:hypothetical protein TNCV_1359061 [Trichonephila clavipes]
MFLDIIHATEKKNQIQRDSVPCTPVKEIPEVSQKEKRPDTSVQNAKYYLVLSLVSKTIIQILEFKFFSFAPRLSRERNETPIAAEFQGLDPVGPCLQTSANQTASERNVYKQSDFNRCI